MRRFIPCALVAALPAALIGLDIFTWQLLPTLIAGFAWLLIYPTLYWLTNRKKALFFSWHFDFVVGLYAIACLFALQTLLSFVQFSLLTALVLAICQFLVFTLPFLELVYFIVYRTCPAEAGIMAIQQTDINEALEFFQTFKLTTRILFVSVPCGIVALFFYGNLQAQQLFANLTPSYTVIILNLIILGALSHYLYKKALPFTGFLELYLETQKYFSSAAEYTTTHAARLQNLIAHTTLPKENPQTFIVVIGESATRDHMSLFSDYARDTTPWLTKNAAAQNFLLFHHAYACWHQTIPVIERAMTEANQYNDISFNNAYSILDMAKKAGFETYWFSNQGHIGCADTQVTLIANTADHAKWTEQEVNKIQYDSSLLDYVKEVDPTKNNFIVLHLMGSHDNFQTRYPQACTIWGKPGKYNLIDNYDNSLAFTDSVLAEIQNYATQHLNLQALLYFSDHATIPDKRRQPTFSGFATVRIPMFLYLADEYISRYPAIYNNLKINTAKYFTNDLVYDFLCGLLQIKSNNFDETNSLTSDKYKFTQENLTTLLGELPLTEDK